MLVKSWIICWLLITSQIVFASVVDTLQYRISKTSNPLEKAELLLKLGDQYEYSEPSIALKFYYQALESAGSVSLTRSQRSLTPEADLIKAKSLRYIGILYSDLGDYEKALESYFEARTILESLKNLYTTPFQSEVSLKYAKLLNNIGIVYSRQGVFGIAKEYYQQALVVYTELGDSTSIAVTFSSLGIVEARMANLTEALSFFRNALDIYTRKNNREGMAQSYNNIGNILFQMSNWDEALRLYSLANDIFQEMGYMHRVATTKGNLGLVYQKKRDFDRAMEFFQSSLDIRKELNDRSGIVESYHNLGSLHAEKDDYRKANEFYSLAYDIAKSIGDQRLIATSLLNISTGHHQRGENRTAVSLANEALEIARNHDLKFVVQTALSQLATYHSAISDYKSAYEYSLSHFDISQEILNEQKARQINELEIEYKAREKQQRIELLEQEGEFTEIQLRQSRTITIILGLLFLTGVIITVFTLVLIKQRNRILILQKENEAEKAIRKTDNDLKAIIKTHAHAMVLLDYNLDILAFNHKAKNWFTEHLGIELIENYSFMSFANNTLKDIAQDALNDSMKGFSRNLQKEIISNNSHYYFRFFFNPVFEEGSQAIQSISIMIEDVTDNYLVQNKILSDLREKETLIKEIHHRVKNNMQVIMSLIRMQSRLFTDDEQKDAFSELEQRIAAMSYVHEDLYKSENFSDIKIDDYLTRITSGLGGFYGSAVRVQKHVNIVNPYIDIDVAMPCGLIINELVSNSMKHGFTGKKAQAKKEKRIDVTFSEESSGYEIMVADNGKGLPADFDFKKASSMGFNLIRIIAEEQLRGELKVKSNGGLTVVVSFPKRS